MELLLRVMVPWGQEVVQRAPDPWGQEVIQRIALDLMWLGLFAGIAFVIIHAVYVRWLAPAAEDEPAIAPPGLPERVERHNASSRGFHWLMAVSMFVLLITAFFPVVGIRFPWVTIHWIAGIALTVLVVYHIVDATFRQDFWAVWVSRRDVADGGRALSRFLSREKAKRRAGKYPLDQKLYHHAASLAAIATIVTGLLMTLRIDTPFWSANPYFLSAGMTGVMFVLHGLAGIGLVTLVIAHVYFAIRPEKLWMTRSMIRGWITREEYLKHYDPDQWIIPDGGHGSPAPAVGPTPSDAETVTQA